MTNKKDNSQKNPYLPVEIRGLILLFASLLTFLSLVSFSDGNFEKNWLGMAGYFLALTLEYLLGLPSYLLIVFTTWASIRLISKGNISNLSIRLFYFGLMMISACLLLNLASETFPSFAAFFKGHVYSQTIMIQSSMTYQKVRYNLGGVPLYYLFKDLPLFNLHRILSPVGITIVFSTTLLLAYLQLTKWNIFFTIVRFSKKLFSTSDEQEITKVNHDKSPSFLSCLFKLPFEKKNLLDNVIIPSENHFKEIASEKISPLKRREESSFLPPSLKNQASHQITPRIFTHEESDIKKENKFIKKPLSQEKLLSTINTAMDQGLKSSYHIPNLSLLTDVKKVDGSLVKKDLTKQAQILEETLASFGIEAKVGQIYCGPTITSFEVHPAVGVKVQKIKTLENDIALNMQAKAIRIIAPIPGKACVGVEIPSPKAQEVSFKELINNYLQSNKSMKIPVLLGKTVTGEDVVSDLTKMPHCIIAGATGSGKSVCINTVVMSILMTAKPDEIKLLMVDPKKVELTAYNNLPHLIAPVITEAAAAAAALNWLVKEMEKRYEMLKQVGVRNIIGFNERVKSAEEPEDYPQKLPYIVGIIDELADLMMVASQDIETPIARIAQMARAVGIHLILATQRPSREVITGLIKANFPTRIAFKVASRVNSQIILDDIGAESLLGNGDMLFLPPGSSTLIRTQGAFIRDEDINKVIRAISDQVGPNYLIKSFDNIQSEDLISKEEASLDTLYGQAQLIVQETGTASTTFLQRKLKIGYARAASLMDQLESSGIIGPQEGAKPRKVLVLKELGSPKRTLPIPENEPLD